MIITILEGHVTAERWSSFEQAYRSGIKTIPTALLQNFLVQDQSDKTLWRIVSIWRSQEDFDELREDSIFTNGVHMYRNVGVEPTRRIFDVKAQHMHV